ncbi:hypothetical protein INT44_008459 [Umbelopsis vinacea]|uniref:Uncharacterized protein n=1 Tax=Umbelopsis vinacea TaxID=44442 RepID=A0A8H7UJW4_9FUNG|nr:hypothetical protein INT44_008459 [Umbelopsis vinacea]
MATLHQQPANIQSLYGNKRISHHPKLLEHKYQQDRAFAHRQSEAFIAKQQSKNKGDNFVTTSLNDDKSTCEKYGLKKRIIPDTPRDHISLPRQSCLSPVRSCKLPSQRRTKPADPVQENTLLNTTIKCDSVATPCEKPCNRRKVSFQDMVVVIPSDDSMEDTDSEDEPYEPAQQYNGTAVFPTLVTLGSPLSCSLQSTHEINSPLLSESDLHQNGHIAKQFKKFGKWFS